MNRYFWSRLVLIGGVILCSTLGWSAQVMAAEEADQEEEVVEIKEVVVSATKTPVPVSHLTSAVEVITEEDLKRLRFRTVDQALRYSQGLAVLSNGGPGTRTQVRIRGANPDQTLVLIDGAIVNSATTGSYNFANLTTY